MSKGVSRFLYTLLAIVLIVYIIYQLFFRTSTAVATEQAIAYSANESISVDAYILRDETIVYEDYTGVLNYSVQNGAHIENHGVIANVYNSEEDIAAKNRIDEIDKQINNLESLLNVDNGSVITDLDSINTQIDEKLVEMLNCVEYGKLGNETKYEDEYYRLIYRRKMIVGNTIDFQDEIKQLKAEKKELESSMDESHDEILSPLSGYFVSSLDGYEGVLTTELVDTLQPGELENISSKTVENEKSVIGKIVSGFNWYMAAEMDFESALRFTEEYTYDIEIPVSNTAVVPAKVVKITKDAKKDKALVIFKCSYMDAGIISSRIQPVKIILDEYEGLRISASALRVVDDVQGVYVLDANIVKFKPIEKIYAGNGYLICKRSKTSKEGLFLYDDVIIKGKDLYDGKTLGK
ncbi:MAG: HlyD family efflux transporter periplasmic adaptor subunit [Acutalibacteraceae bacterium]|nr:HlyD family efflux transporter periplasmic adaptor subunit [Acutalibacteraceae bacterium]